MTLRMRRLAALLMTALVLVDGAASASSPEELARARVLDQQGVRAYKEGRYNDAIKYFSEAFKLGGPPSELWNMAKCHMRLDEPENASDAYDRYLMQPGLSPQDKAEARAELEELRRRRSIVTIASAPNHATVYIDGNRAAPAGITPFSVQVAPGTHKVEIEQKGYKPHSEDVEAKFGRAIIVDAQLERDPAQVDPDKDKGDKGARPSTELDAPHKLTAKADMGLAFSKLGSYAQGARFAFGIAGAYWLVDGPSGLFGVGLRLDVTSDAWGNSIGAPVGAANCGSSIPTNESSTEIAGYGIGTFGYRLTPRLRLGADAGLGVAGYTGSTLGGDIFFPTCQANTGAQIAARGGVEVSYVIVPRVRAFGTPLSIQVHPSYGGARPTPIDATGAWVRFGVGLGVAVDL